MMMMNLWRIASHLLFLLLVAVLIVPLSGPARAQEAGQTVTFDMVSVGITGKISGAVSLRIPQGYKLVEEGQDDISWGEEMVSPKHYEYRGTKVFERTTLDGEPHSSLGQQADGIGFGGGILFKRGIVDIKAQAEQYLRPHVEGTIYEEGAITVPGYRFLRDGHYVEHYADYHGCYYLSTSTIEYPFKTVNYHLQLRVALSQSQPLYTVTLWSHTWGLPDGIQSDGRWSTYTIDGKPQLAQHKKYIKDLLTSISIVGWKAPAAAPITTPELTPVTAPALDQSQTSIPGNTGLEGDWWLSQGFIPSMPILTSVEVYVGTDFADLSNPLTLQIRGDSNGLPSGSVLASTDVTITRKGWGWITFDIPDLQVNPGTAYHLVLASKSNYHVGLDSTNPYSYGSMGYSIDAGAGWKLLNDNPNYDMAFKIYGTG